MKTFRGNIHILISSKSNSWLSRCKYNGFEDLTINQNDTEECFQNCGYKGSTFLLKNLYFSNILHNF